jgi:hypothetical protein
LGGYRVILQYHINGKQPMKNNNMLRFEQTSFQVEPEVHSAVSSANNYRVVCSPEPEKEALVPYKNLVFPLNVYAHALVLEEGRADALHYGLFKNYDTPIREAQQYSTSLILSRLPVSSSRILEVGVGLGTTFLLLSQGGHKVHGITPDNTQITLLRERFGQNISVSCQRLENFEAAAESFDLLLFQESAQYIEPLVIFNKALDMLPCGGSILILDEFVLRQSEAESDGLHVLSNVLTLAKRLGFELVEHLDLSSMAAPTLGHLLHITTAHRNRLIQDLALNVEILEQLDESNRNYQKKYAEGRYGYALLQFRKKTVPKWRIGLLEEKQSFEMQDLFKKTFGHDLTSEMWQWKYGRESSYALGGWRENRLIAHYGGMPRDVLLFGEPKTVVQIGDVMVDPAERGVLTRKGPFFLLAATFQECYVGYGKAILTGYGFPNKRAMQVAERLGLYTQVGSMTEVEWKPSGKIPHCLTRLREIDSQDDIWKTSVIDDLWHKMAADLREALVGLRDNAYLRYRYLDHPHHSYQLLLVVNRFSGQIRGLIVLRHNEHETEIMDLIAPFREIPLMIAHARRVSGINGKSRLFIQIPKNFVARFTATGGVQTAQDIPIPAPAWSYAPAADVLRDRWWLTGGDMDFR